MYHAQSASARIAQTVSAPPAKTVPPQPSKLSTPIRQPYSPNPQPKQVTSRAPVTKIVPTPRVPVTSGIPVDYLAGEEVLGVGALNTHFFDGKMAETTSIIHHDVERARGIPQKDKLQAFDKLLAVLRMDPLWTPNAATCFSTVYQSTISYFGQTHGANQNYDPANRLHADDLLYLLYEKIVEEGSAEHASLLAVQLDEMATGLCAQGRTTRFLQVLIMLRDDLTPTSKPPPSEVVDEDIPIFSLGGP